MITSHSGSLELMTIKASSISTFGADTSATLIAFLIHSRCQNKVIIKFFPPQPSMFSTNQRSFIDRVDMRRNLWIMMSFVLKSRPHFTFAMCLVLFIIRSFISLGIKQTCSQPSKSFTMNFHVLKLKRSFGQRCIDYLDELSLEQKPPSRRPSSANWLGVEQKYQRADFRWRQQWWKHPLSKCCSRFEHTAPCFRLCTQWQRLTVTPESTFPFKKVHCSTLGLSESSLLGTYFGKLYWRRQLPGGIQYRWSN